jgi:hypothetical protein
VPYSGIVKPCRSFENRHFGGTCFLHPQDRKNARVVQSVSQLLCCTPEVDFFYPEDGGDELFRNFSSQKAYMTPHGIRRH